MRLAPFRLGSWWPALRPALPRRPSLAIVTCIKNEGEDLVEWLCYHRLIGVSRFVIYDNLSTDATLRILDAIPFRDEIIVHSVSDESAQRFAFSDAIKRYRHEFDWVAFLDGDEFIVPLGDTSIVDKLAELEAREVDGFGINWRTFGSSGHKVRPRGLVTESFTRRAGDGFAPDLHVKSVVRAKAIDRMVTQHYFRVAGTYVLDDGTVPAPTFKGVAKQTSFSQGFAVFHYITKSRAQCLRKIARGRPMPRVAKGKFRDISYFKTHDRNEVRDFRAAQVIAPIRTEVWTLRAAIEASLHDNAPAQAKAAGQGN